MPEATADLNLIRVFCAIYESRSVTGAARRLGISQPSVSHALQRLRTAYRDSMFVRSGRGVVATPRARELYPGLRAGLDQLEATLSTIDAVDPVVAPMRLRLWLTDLGERAFLPIIIPALRDRAPQALLEIRPLVVARVESALHRGEVDGVICSQRLELPGVQRSPLLLDDYVVLAAADHPRIGETLSAAEFAAEPHIGLASEVGHAAPTAIAEARFPQLRTVLHVPRIGGIPDVVRHTDCLAVVPRFLAELERRRGGLKVLAHPLQVPHAETALYHHDRSRQTAAQRWLTDLILETCRASAFGGGAEPSPRM
ncbi:LysR family transcriptional regulator [Enemella evansiae]|uniref:LysR family transcriptional regulator n=1 Tax=Enemella evansiae TaxID=2016499 RepID=UPI000B97999E|nr:LysR family transcriptional regulator [Enemella evansiae]OYO09161.1 LysR family transcriptional regulator [Enemella evansiae]